MADTHRIHLVRPSQVPSKPKSLEPADIASHALTIAKECTETLNALQDYSEMMIGQISAQLAQLEIIALRVPRKRGSLSSVTITKRPDRHCRYIRYLSERAGKQS